jgi:hypothetical protein
MGLNCVTTKLRTFVAACASLVLLCCDETAPSTPGDKGMVQSPSDITQLRKSALNGDNAAAHTLAVHYDAVGDSAESLRWLEIAAMRGDCVATEVVLERKYRAGAPEAERRRWRVLAERNGCRYDAKLLEQMLPSSEGSP